MSEKELNENYVRDKIQGICQDCIYLNKIVPIINEMLSEQYVNGLEQSRFDKRMLADENEQLKKALMQDHNKIKYWTNIVEDLEKFLDDVLNELKENDVYDRSDYEIGQIIATECFIEKIQELKGENNEWERMFNSTY